MVDGNLKPYKHYREYTDEEIRDEQDEYFSNAKTKKALPNLFRDRDDVTYHVKDSKLELLDMQELQSLKNSDIKSILSEPTQKARMLATLKLMKQYDKDYKSLYRGFYNNEKLPPPLVVRDKEGSLYLLAGNSRLMMAAAFGYNMPVKIVKYKKTIVSERSDINVLADVAKKIVRGHNLKSKLKFSKGSGNKADYDWESDTITLTPNPKSDLDFVESVLHEVDHALMRKKYGATKYEELYSKAGEMMIQKGKDFYWDNPFEVQARKYEKNGRKWLRKLNMR